MLREQREIDSWRSRVLGILALRRAALFGLERVAALFELCFLLLSMNLLIR